jgi:hypothetical protein
MAAVAYNGAQRQLRVKRRCRSNVKEYDDGCDQCIRVLAMLWFHTPKRHDWASVVKSVSMIDRDDRAIDTLNIIKTGQLSSVELPSP